MVVLRQRCLKGTFFVINTIGGMIALMYMFIYNNMPTVRDFNATLTPRITNNVNFLVNTDSCRIPDFDPMDPSVRDVIGGPHKFKCDRFPSLAYQNGNTLFIDWKTIEQSKYKEIIKYCTVSPITRPVTPETNHDSWNELLPSEPFNVSYNVKDEFVHMKCYNVTHNTTTYENYYSFVLEKESVEKKCKENILLRKTKFVDAVEPLSVMIVGIDSVSRLNSIRFMKNTRNYLSKELGAIELLGYNKVGDNTFHNMIPLYTGKYASELPWYEEKQEIFDNFTFIWDKFSEAGYRTMYIEDFPEGGLFDYKKPGFHKTPTDYFDRHFHLAFENRKEFWYTGQNCFIDKSQTDIVFDYTSRFMSTFKSKPYFGSVFVTRLTHDYIGRAAMADDISLNFLQRIKNDGSLNNTILIFMSDHGIRFGDIRQRYIGKIEERLPMMFVILPKWFKQRYPEVTSNLRINARRLTSQFDIDETLRHIISFNGSSRKTNIKARAYSIFDKIPESRSCSDASIESHWCTCSELESMNKSHSMVQKSAKFLVYEINKFLEKSKNLCEVLYLDQIQSAFRFIPSMKELSKVYQTFQITILVKPGGGAFEGTILYDTTKKSLRLSGDVSRINSYGKQKRCAVESKLEKLCFCK